MQSLLRLLTAAIVFLSAACAQVPGGILDVFTVKVKPEKRADFDALSKKVAEANQKYKGDHWVTFSVEYGEQNTLMFASPRDNYSAIDGAATAFMGALKEGFGPTFPKLFQESNSYTISSRSEIRRRRLDLSWNVPTDMAAVEQHVGKSRYMRVLTVRVRAGHAAGYEEAVKLIKSAFEKAPNRGPTFVSQSATGQVNGTYYFSTFGKSMADFDPPSGGQTLRELMGDSNYERYQKAASEGVLMSESTIARIVPELSSPTDAMANADPAFWHPKPAAAAKPAKPKAVTTSTKPAS